MMHILGISASNFGKDCLSTLTQKDKKKPKIKKLMAIKTGTLAPEGLVNHTLKHKVSEYPNYLPKNIGEYVKKDLLRIASRMKLKEEKTAFLLVFSGNLRWFYRDEHCALESLVNVGDRANLLKIYAQQCAPEDEQKNFDTFDEVLHSSLFPDVKLACQCMDDILIERGEKPYGVENIYKGLAPLYLACRERELDKFLTYLLTICIDLKDIRPFMYIYHSHKDDWDFGSYEFLFHYTLEAIDRHFVEMGEYGNLRELVNNKDAIVDKARLLEAAAENLAKGEGVISETAINDAGNGAMHSLLKAGFTEETVRHHMYCSVIEIFSTHNANLKAYGLEKSVLTLKEDGLVEHYFAFEEEFGVWIKDLSDCVNHFYRLIANPVMSEAVKLKVEKMKLKEEGVLGIFPSKVT